MKKNKKKILVILGHPYKESLNKDIADSYIKGAKKNFDVRKIYLCGLKFDPTLHYGYTKIQGLEPELVKAQKLISWADHIVFVYPIWWGSMPAVMKGFIDRTFLPGFAFIYQKDGKLDKYLKGKTGSLIVTTGGSKWIYFFVGRIMNLPVTQSILRFCGIKPKKQIFFCGIRKLDEAQTKEILDKAEKLGEKGI